MGRSGFPSRTWMNRRAGCANWRTKTVSVRRSAFWTRECRWFSEQNKDLLYRRIFVGCPSLFKEASVAQLVEHHLAKVNVEGSNPFARSIFSQQVFSTLNPATTRALPLRRLAP